MRKSRELFALVVFILAVPLPTSAADRGNGAVADPLPVPVLGQVISREIELNGLRVPSGSTVLNRSLLRTENYPAVLHLNTGDVLELDKHSSVYLEKTTDGKTRVFVTTGALFYRQEADPPGLYPSRQWAEIRIAPSQSILYFPLKKEAGPGTLAETSLSTDRRGQEIAQAVGQEGRQERPRAVRTPEATGEAGIERANSSPSSSAPAQPVTQEPSGQNLSQEALVQITNPRPVLQTVTVSVQNLPNSSTNTVAAIVIAVREEIPASPSSPKP